MISARNLSLSYRGENFLSPKTEVFRGVNFSVKPRGRMAILGDAGSGKTTLLRIISGVLPPTTGLIRRSGSVSFPLGFMGAGGRVSVLQYIRFAARCYRVDEESFLSFVIDFADVGDLLDRQMGKVEADRRSRINFTIGYGLPFHYYVFDSRLSTGDAQFREKCMQMLEIRMRTSGLILATRRPSVARQLCTSAGVLRDGRFFYFEDVNRAVDFYESIQVSEPPRSADAYYTPSDAMLIE